MHESTETAATVDPHTAEGRRGPSWRGWVLSLLAAIVLWLCALAIGTVARAEEPVEPVHRYIDAAFAGNPSLDGMRERIRVKENAAIKAGALDDPKLRVGITEPTGQSLGLPARGYDGEGDRHLTDVPLAGDAEDPDGDGAPGEGRGGIRP